MKAEEIEHYYNLVELSGAHAGEIHRSELMTVGEAKRRNDSMSGTVIEWQLPKAAKFASNPPNSVSSQGNKATAATVQGKPVIIGVNAYIQR